MQLNSYGLADTLSFIEDRLQLTLGVRYQEVESSNLFVPTSTLTKYKKNATTPGAAILFKATDKVSIYANYIEGLTKGDAAPYCGKLSNNICTLQNKANRIWGEV